MHISIDMDSSEPLFAQLISEIKRAVQSRQKQPGDPLPSIRQLAGELQLNNKTVAKAYRMLERDQVIETRGYRGTFVHSDALSNSKVDLNSTINSALKKTIVQLRQAGATDSEIRIAFTNIMKARG